MRCASCGAENPAGVGRCFACGQRLSATAVQAAVRWGLRGPQHLEERLALAPELLASAHQADDRERELWIRLQHVADLAEAGRLADTGDELERSDALAGDLGNPYYAGRVATARAMVALARGALDEGEQLAAESLRLLEAAGDPGARPRYVLQLLPLRRAQGREAELAADVERCAALEPSARLWPVIGALLAERPDRELLAADPAPSGGDVDAALAAALAEACARTGEAAGVARLEALLRAHEGHHLVLRGAAYWGPADRLLGLLASLAGDRSLAARRAADAVDMAEACGAEPSAAQARHDLATALPRSERARAIAVLEPALATAVRLHLARLGTAILGVKLKAQGATATTSITTVYGEVRREGLSLSLGSSKDGTITVLFSDIESSTELNERAGDARWVEILRRHARLVRGEVAAHGGRVIKSQGDGFMAVFTSPRDAVSSAIALQRSLAGPHGSAIGDDDRLRVRIGIHTGAALEDEGDFFGRNVTLAARIADSASGGEILVSSALKDLAAGEGFAFDAGHELALKGLRGPHRVHRVDWHSVPHLTNREAQRA